MRWRHQSSIINRDQFSAAPVFTHDKARPSSECQVRPGPLQNDTKPVFESCQVINVHHEPDEPREETAQPDRPDLEYRFRPANRRHLPLVHEMKWTAWPAFQFGADRPCEVSALLHRDRRCARKRLSRLMRISRLISSYKNFG